MEDRRRCTCTSEKTQGRFFVVRHAESEANVEGLIVSDPEHGTTSYGLTDNGRQQVVQVACQQLMTLVGETQSDLLSDKLIVISSDFKRARETAEIIHRHFKIKEPLRIHPSLRERDFGELNLTDSKNYQKVWNHDSKNPHHEVFKCESVMSVLSRTRALIEELEKEFENEDKMILLVSHGDTLQITLTAYSGVAPECHKSLPHLGNCDVRELVKPFKEFRNS